MVRRKTKAGNYYHEPPRGPEEERRLLPPRRQWTDHIHSPRPIAPSQNRRGHQKSSQHKSASVQGEEKHARCPLSPYRAAQKRTSLTAAFGPIRRHMRRGELPDLRSPHH